MSPETTALLDTIAKLKAKAEGTNNEAEAALFAAKVAELLAKHNLDEAMLRARDADREQGPLGKHPFGQRVPDAWRERILIGVAKLYQCQTMFHRKGSAVDQWSWQIVGREHNAIVAKAMAEYLFATVKRMAREYSPVSREQKDYRKGAGDRLYHRLWTMAEEQRKPTSSSGDATGTALMVVTEDQAIAEYLGDIKQSKGKGHKYGEASYDGYEEAGRIGLNTQVKETRAERMLS